LYSECFVFLVSKRFVNYSQQITELMENNSSESRVMGDGLADWQGKKFAYTPYWRDLLLAPFNFLSNGYRGLFSPEVNWPGREACQEW
jgi:hypothetical protein